MKVSVVGAGPAGLYLAILLKRDDPGHRVTVFERNRVEDTFGFGVVFSDETLENLGQADPGTDRALAAEAAGWQDIEIHYRGTVLRSTGHRFSGVERKTLLEVLAGRAHELGVELHWRQEIRDLTDCGLPDADLIVAADGADQAKRCHLVQVVDRRDWLARLGQSGRCWLLDVFLCRTRRTRVRHRLRSLAACLSGDSVGMGLA